ncbi:triple QxxK/R motif-containing protein [Rhinoraja longicauda]
MGRKDASASKTPIDHYRKQIGKQDYKKTKSVLKATRLKAEAKKTAPGIKDVILIVVAILILLVAVYGFFYLKFNTDVDVDPELDRN